MNTTKLQNFYTTLHDSICGSFPNENIFHELFLSSFRHRKALMAELKNCVNLSVLDVGCGQQPYRAFLGPSCRYVGIDIEQRHPQTIVIEPGRPWPIDGPFDVIVCTQVVEHVADIKRFCAEIDRVLAPGGKLLVSVPFIYPIHDDHDYRRMTPAGVSDLFKGWSIEKVELFGGLGSTVAILLNTWPDNVFCFSFTRRLIKGLIFPIRLPLQTFFNIVALLVDLLDGTKRYFHNSLLILRKVDP